MFKKAFVSTVLPSRLNWSQNSDMLFIYKCKKLWKLPSFVGSIHFLNPLFFWFGDWHIQESIHCKWLWMQVLQIVQFWICGFFIDAWNCCSFILLPIIEVPMPISPSLKWVFSICSVTTGCVRSRGSWNK